MDQRRLFEDFNKPESPLDLTGHPSQLRFETDIVALGLGNLKAR
jgi:hypothetical protein